VAFQDVPLFGEPPPQPLLAVQQQLPSYASPECFHMRAVCSGGLYRTFCPAEGGEEQFAGARVRSAAGERCSTLQVMDPLPHTKPSQCIQALGPTQHCSPASVMHLSFF